MANENETITEVLAEFGKNIELMRKCKCVGVSLWNCLKYKLRIEAAHNREIAAKNEEIAQLNKSVERWMEYHDTMKCERDAFLDEIKKKDAEIERLKDENANLRVINCGSIYAEGNLREEIERLRSLVGELASALDGFTCKGDCVKYCVKDSKDKEECVHLDNRALIARAREIVRAREEVVK